ncbi:malonate decarboxylase holo-[acyl-carrier-protein] synthase [Anaeromyxobacter oryzae]|uniref:Phosphoribosyl-dephospho-CoA transferase n=1 Tax=Anaeromyxobacter oryzae TaxID=2918170 RepID=A0ABM7X126_9BACT|nr:malonate decarboxylase holo-[acyl-carrier-protein] synthase [Anaeromyxobacter oryzae]BDG05499.1 phosphoribosyl-dephospho-CoA transferase [Anaeromyxobacter oryzae]
MRLPADAACAAELARWLDLARPAVVRRHEPGLGAAEVALGVPLPPARGGTRIAFAAEAAALARVAAPLGLRDAIRAAPCAWRAPLAELTAEARAAGLVLRVHGSLAWQALTGDAYLRDGSDVDLLVPARGAAAVARALALLGRWASRAPPPLDGELVVAAGGVAWRELLAAPARVLLKGDDGVSLVPLEEVLGPRPARAGGEP